MKHPYKLLSLFEHIEGLALEEFHDLFILFLFVTAHLLVNLVLLVGGSECE